MICDACGAELRHSHATEDWSLMLTSRRKLTIGDGDGTVKPREIDRTHAFCGLDCLDAWRRGWRR